MAEDYLTDDEQWEAVKRWSAENGLWMVGGVVMGAALLFGWRQYQSHGNEIALRASAAFGEMTAALERDDRIKSRQVADGIIKDYPESPYADQARLIVARLFVDDGKLPNAIGPLTQVMSSSKDKELRHVARLRLARVLIDEGKPDEAIQTLSEGTPGAFAARYHEVRGDAFTAKKDLNSAAAEYKAALSRVDVAGDDASGGLASGVDTALLELKIADLGAPPTAATVPAAAPAATIPAPAAAVTTAAPTNKAKP